MPEIYSSCHDEFLMRFLEILLLDINFERESYINKEKKFLVKNSSGYVFPVFSKVGIISDDPITFIGTFRSENTIKNYNYFITNKEGIITEISSSSIINFKLDNAAIKKKIKIDQYVKNLLKLKKFFSFCFNHIFYFIFILIKII